MVVEIERPTFKCAEDEKIFISRLREIDGYESVIGAGSSLRLSVASSSGEALRSELQKICDIWHTVFRVLEQK